MLLGQQAVLATWHICYVRIEIASFSCSWLGRFGYGSKLYCLSRKTTLLRCHQEAFRLFWKHQSKARATQPRISPETIALIREMATQKRLPMGKHRSSSFVCDNESKFGPWFARVATTGAIEILKTPSRAPQGNAICERFMRHIGFDPVHDDS